MKATDGRAEARGGSVKGFCERSSLKKKEKDALLETGERKGAEIFGTGDSKRSREDSTGDCPVGGVGQTVHGPQTPELMGAKGKLGDDDPRNGSE